MIRIELGAEGLGRTRFALPPLNIAADLLHSLRLEPHAVEPRWRARAGQALRTRRLGLLAVLGGGGPHGYAPDFLRPEPRTFHPTLDAALHAVATASPARVRYELSEALNGHSWDGTPAGRPPKLLLDAVQRGESHLAQRAADEMAQFWEAAFAPHWAELRQQLDEDIAARSAAIARDGVSHALTTLSPNVTWRNGGLDVRLRTAHTLAIDADALILTPCPFRDRATFCAGEPEGTPDPRTPMICYPALRPASARPPLGEELIGASRARLLAELAQPRTTAELAARLHLSRATVSYHLQILHRAGLLHRTRASRHVLYTTAAPQPCAR